MPDAIIHFARSFSAEQIETTWSDPPRPTPAEVNDLIESAWTAALARLGSRLYDGPMVRLNSWRIDGDRLRLNLGRTSYKPFMGTNLMHADLADRYGPEILANPLGLSAALESADGFLLLGRRNEHVAFYPNRIHTFAGTAEGADVFAGIRKELEEELKLGDSDIADIRCIGLAEDPSIRQPELIFYVKSKRSRREIECHLDAKEHLGLVAFDNPDRAIGEPDLTPVARASVSLWRYGATRRQ